MRQNIDQTQQQNQLQRLKKLSADPQPQKTALIVPQQGYPTNLCSLTSLKSLNNIQLIFPSFHSNLDMALIETPANPGNQAYQEYLDHIDGARSISKIIAWTGDSEYESNSLQLEEFGEDEIDDNGDGDQIGCGRLNFTEEKISYALGNFDQEKSMEPYLRTPFFKQEGKRTPFKLDTEQKNLPQPLKTCNCKKTQCLKLYCDCFRQNRKCQGCACVGCHNTADNQLQILHTKASLKDKNPQAFQPKIKVQSSEHTKGCNCKKSYCLKKYCQCYQAGLKCGDNCKCEDCKNCDKGENKRNIYQKYQRKNIPANFRLKSNTGALIIVRDSN